MLNAHFFQEERLEGLNRTATQQFYIDRHGFFKMMNKGKELVAVRMKMAEKLKEIQR